ncbi:MAG: hypothetical protein WC856_02365 [Methylococcaceae bacterium]
MNNLGFTDGEKCNRNGCTGIIREHPVENCSCHIHPPCSSCTDPKGYCETCQWEEADDPVPESKYTGKVWQPQPPRKLDPTKIDWKAYSTDTGCTMIKRGVYPPGTTMEELRKVVNGTFGGRFNYCADGKFEFVAYTD